jgi:hypothetical protein
MCGAFRVYGISEFSSGDGMHREKPDAAGETVRTDVAMGFTDVTGRVISIVGYVRQPGTVIPMRAPGTETAVCLPRVRQGRSVCGVV